MIRGVHTGRREVADEGKPGIHEFDYWHQDRKVNPKHRRSLVDFYLSGVKAGAAAGTNAGPKTSPVGGLGVEIEHLPVRSADNPLGLPAGQAVTFAEPHGIAQVLQDLRPLFDPAREFHDEGYLLGLAKKGYALSLEPGGQVECSLDVAVSGDQVAELYSLFRADIDPVLHKHGIELLTYGYQPHTLCRQIPIIPKARYHCMDQFFGRLGSFGPNMMRASASTQVSIDYYSQEDAIEKLRLGTALGPISAYFYRNSPYFEGRRNPYPLLRQHFWESIDPNRAGILPGLYDDGFDFERAADDILAAPLMVADLTHTPEAAISGKEEDRLVSMETYANAAEIYPDRELNPYEINHIISTHFNDVRLKNFLELRPWDSLPIDRVRTLSDQVSALFYDRSHLERAASFFRGVRAVDVEEAKISLQAHGDKARPYGEDLDFWRGFLTF
ncbi:MAG: glutamate-cysteine ligase family protein [Parascardovia denticolens]